MIQVDLYEKIKLLASEKKMSIRQLEETLGFGNGVINRWRKNTPGSDKLKKVADYFDVSVDYLLGRTENPNTVENENANISPEFFAIQRKSKKLSQKEQQKLLKLMELTFEEIDNGDFEEDDDDDL
nr:helix-turn-helix transcriptional regulator [Enterococcus faecalis]